MKQLGLLLIGVGLAWSVIAFNLTTTVQSGGERVGDGQFSIYIPRSEVYNIGMIERRRTHQFLGGGCILAGILMFGFGSLREKSSEDLAECPQCAEDIKPHALRCKHCGADLTSYQAALASQENEELEDLGITYDGQKYYFREHSYLEQDDAVRQARLQAVLDQQA